MGNPFDDSLLDDEDTLAFFFARGGEKGLLCGDTLVTPDNVRDEDNFAKVWRLWLAHLNDRFSTRERRWKAMNRSANKCIKRVLTRLEEPTVRWWPTLSDLDACTFWESFEGSVRARTLHLLESSREANRVGCQGTVEEARLVGIDAAQSALIAALQAATSREPWRPDMEEWLDSIILDEEG
ncbi:MAG: hypothetical protein KC619_05940 [Myxococcales bacterium]|nr:hypothetical protein [Myxococcales bacterium]